MTTDLTTTAQLAEPAEKTFELLGDELLEEFMGVKVPLQAFTVTRRGVAEPQIGVAVCDLGAALGYTRARSARVLVARHRDEFLEDLVQVDHQGITSMPRDEPSANARLYLVGGGVDLFLMHARRPKAVEFRRWLKERSHDLRTRGVARADRTMAEIEADGQLHHTFGLENLRAAQQLLVDFGRNLGERQLQLEQRADQAEQRVAAVEGKLDELRASLDRNTLGAGELTLTAVARRVRWHSAASDGQQPHPAAVRLAMVCHRFDRRQLLRTRRIEVDGGEVVDQWVVTAEGVEAFEREVVPMYPTFGRFVIRPNREAERAGLTKRANVIRVSHED